MSQNLSYQQRRAARLDDPSLEHLRNPRTRRRLAFGLIGLVIVEAIVLVGVSTIELDGLLPVAVFLGVMVVMIFAMVMLLGALKASTRGVEELSPDVLDERQAQLRGDLFQQSYWILAAIAILASILMSLMSQPWWAVPDTLPLLTVALMVQLIVIIPTLVTALRVRV